MMPPKSFGHSTAKTDPPQGERENKGSNQPPAEWLPGAGEMRQLIRDFDWSKHELGAPQSWPQSLKTVVRMMLDSRYAMWAGWGKDLTFFYNDTYGRDTLGKKHPWALGQPAREVWAEIWQEIGPRIEHVLKTGQATWDEGLMLFLTRNGYLEETYHTFSYSPLYDDEGARGGMLCVVTEETRRVISERRLSLLRELGANTTLARTIDEACNRFIQTLSHNLADIPFALIYLLDPGERRLVLKGAVQVEEGHPARFPEISLEDRSRDRWPVGAALAEKRLIVINDLESSFGAFSGGKYAESPTCAVALPIPGADAEHPVGALVLGVSPRRALDDDYEGFFQLVAGQFATAISNAQSYEKERQRAESLTELDRAKTAFFSNVSHEFRTPLTLMLGPLEELLRRDGGGTSAEMRGELEVIHRNSLRLLKLVNTLLDFSRIEAGRIEANYERIDLAAFTRDLTSLFRSMMEKAGLRFEVQCEALPEPVYVDRDMWEKIVFNLLSNAFKFTFEGGVSVRLTAENGAVVLRVSDTGAGIPPEEIGNIFKRFHRVQSARARTHEGTGIGLALVHELVKLHGGSINVESQAGQGTTFTVRIPFGSAHLPQERVDGRPSDRHKALRGDAFIEEASRWELPEQAEESLIEKPAAASPGTAKLSRVLIADDNADMRDYIARLLQDRYEVETVSDGAAALAAARRNKPDIILSDIMMPEMDGFGLLKAVREDEALRGTPVIFLSARAGGEALIEGIEQGADDYLVKPFNGRELVARLETHLKLAQIRQESVVKERTLREEAQSIQHSLELINRIGATLVAELELEKLVQAVTDAGREITGAEFGAFFYNVKNEKGESYMLYTLSGAPREAFAKFPMPRNTELFGPTFRGEGIIRLDDVLADPRYGKSEPYQGMPKGHLPVRSYLAAPVISRSGEVLGGLFYGHSTPGVFTAQAEAIIGAVAAQAAIGIDNAQLYRAAQRLAAIVESSDEIIISKDLNGVITSWNRGAERIFGYRADEIVGKPINVLMPPDRAAEEARILDSIRRGERIDHYETVRRRKDGTLVDVSLSVSPIRDPKGKIVGASKVGTDITERVRAKEKLEATVAERTASLRDAVAQMEEFSYTVSHDLRAPLRAMKGFAVAALEDYGGQLDDTGRKYLTRIVQGGDRMDRLIQDVLNYSRVARAVVTLGPVDADHVVREILQHYPEFDPARARITIAEKLPKIRAHELMFGQVISNLLSNAVKFVPPGTMPEILIRAETGEETVKIWIEDNGIGIEPEYQGRLFGMFERVHPQAPYEGTGIGLAIVRKATERMGGKVGVKSDGKRGSQFWVELPKA